MALAGVELTPERPAAAEGFTDRPCGKERAHWEHTWFGAAETGSAVRVGAWWCRGRQVVSAAFADHRYVQARRCYQGDGAGGVCRRMLIIEEPDGLAEPGELHGWVMREHRAPGGGEREWQCPEHAGGTGLSVWAYPASGSSGSGQESSGTQAGQAQGES